MFNSSDLQARFSGKVITPGDEGYDVTRQVFYGGIENQPVVIVMATTQADVIETIQLARDNNLELVVRSGGHSFAGYSSTHGGVVLDLREMKTVDIDTKAKTVWAGTGLTARELLVALDPHDFILGFGDAGSVGIGGITLGGGVGFLVRKLGMTIDNLLAVRMVTADGNTLEVDSVNHPDLFWAIRGGGGNFGVVTDFKFQLYSANQVVGGMLILPAVPEVVSKFLSEAHAAPDELSTILNIMPAPPMPFLPKEQHGKLIAMALILYVGDPAQAEKILAPFRALAAPIADMIKPMRYVDMFPPEEGSYHPTAVSRTMHLTHVDTKLAENVIAKLEASDAPMRVVQLRVLGGAMARVPSEATAYAHRTNAIMANIAAFYETTEEKTSRDAWVTAVSTLLFQGDTSIYSNFMRADEHMRLHDAYPGTTLDRLSTIKQQYDPTNFFHRNLNIPPRQP